jgi:outer membrane lipoprotein-sorting protein
MGRSGSLFLAGLGMLILSLTGRAQDASCRAIVEKAIQAHGGAKNLAKTANVQSKAKGKAEFMGGFEFTVETSFKSPDKFRVTVETVINNTNINVVQVFNGKKLWLNVNGKTIPMNDDKVAAELKEKLYLEKLSNLIGLLEKGVELSPLGEVKVKGQDAVGVRASSKGHRDINLFFDKKTGMVLKTEFHTLDLNSMKEVNQETYSSDYHEVEGVQVPRRVTIYHDGQLNMAIEITSTAFPESLDDNLFVEP